MSHNHQGAVEILKARIAYTPAELSKIGEAVRNVSNRVEWAFQSLDAFHERYFRMSAGTEDLEVYSETCPALLAGQLSSILYLLNDARIELNTLADPRNVELYPLWAEARAIHGYLNNLEGVTEENA